MLEGCFLTAVSSCDFEQFLLPASSHDLINLTICFWPQGSDFPMLEAHSHCILMNVFQFNAGSLSNFITSGAVELCLFRDILTS